MSGITVEIVIKADDVIVEKYYLSGRETSTWLKYVFVHIKATLRLQTIHSLSMRKQK